MKDLAPNIYRQRMVIEGTYEAELNAAKLRKFMKNLSVKLGMKIILGPIVKNLAGKINPFHKGLECIMIWAESGASIYVWDEHKFFTMDIYTCKKFDPKVVVKMAKEFFEAKEIVSKNV